MTQVIDFDKWRAERDAKQEPAIGPVFRIGGEEYQMPAEPPATIALDVIRLKEAMEAKDGADASVPLDALAKIGNTLFGRETFREMLAKNNVGAAEMGNLVLMAVSVWHQDVDIDESAAVPNRKTRRARKPSTS